MGLFSSTDNALQLTNHKKLPNVIDPALLSLVCGHAFHDCMVYLGIFVQPHLSHKVHSLTESQTTTPIHNMTNTAHKVHCTVQATHLYLIILKLTLIPPLNHLCFTINSFIICHTYLSTVGQEQKTVFESISSFYKQC